MPMVGWLGASILRGNETDFYIRIDDDLMDIETDPRRAAEYPHVHVSTTGPNVFDEIVFISLSFGPERRRPNITIFRDGDYLQSWYRTVQDLYAHCPGIAKERVPNLARYLHGMPFVTWPR